MEEYQVHHSYHSAALMTTPAVFLALAVIFTAIRFFVRGCILRKLVLDDWLILVTLCAFMGQCGLLIFIAWEEMHRDILAIRLYTKMVEQIVLECSLYLMTTIFLKLSLAIFFLRLIFPQWQRWVVIISTAIFSLYNLAIFFLAIFSCGNPKFYVLRQLEGVCVDWNTVLGPMNFAQGGMNALTDWIFVSLPILVIQKANMRRKEKWSVILVLSIGALGSIVSIVRFFYIDGLHPKSEEPAAIFKSAYKIAIISIVEPGLGIIAACMATMRPLFKASSRYPDSCSKPKGSETVSGHAADTNWSTPRRSEFAAYGFDLEMQAEDEKDEPVVVVQAQEQPSETAVPWANGLGGRLDRRGSAALVAQLVAAREAYKARESQVGHARIACLIPDVDDA